MKISRKAQREAKRLFRHCLVDGQLEEARVRTVVGEVTKGKPRGYLAILTRFERLVRLEINRRLAKVQSAQALTPPFQSALEQNLTQLYGPGLAFAFAEDPGLIGGMRVQVGSDVYDGSVRARLNQLREQF
jgi:F-type H+-transporting ATPase subunit delta